MGQGPIWNRPGIVVADGPGCGRARSATRDLDSLHDITFVWVKGHSTNPHNNRCDELAVTACKSADLATDDGYEAAQQRKNAQSMLFEL